MVTSFNRNLLAALLAAGLPAALAGAPAVAWNLELPRGRTARTTVKVIEETARDLGPPGRDDQFGWGAVDVCRALSKLTGDAGICRSSRLGPRLSRP